MEYQNLLRSLCSTTPGNTTIVQIECPVNTNMRSVIIDKDSLHRLCGFGTSTASRYLDEQVSEAILITVC